MRGFRGFGPPAIVHVEGNALSPSPIARHGAPVLLLLPAFVSHDDDDNGLLPAGRS